MAKPNDLDVLRAAKLSRVPGVTIEQACKRFGVAKSAVQRARRAKPPEIEPSLAELVLAALTGNGADTKGTLGDLSRIAGWIDYLNHDGCTPADVRRLLAECVESGHLVIDGERWELVKPWP